MLQFQLREIDAENIFIGSGGGFSKLLFGLVWLLLLYEKITQCKSNIFLLVHL